MRLILHLCLLVITITTISARELVVHIGSYKAGSIDGILTAKFDTETGMLSHSELASSVGNPSFLARSPDGRTLYAVSDPTRSVHAYAVAANGNLTKLNDLPCVGAGPCDVATDATGRTLVIANYNGGSVTVYSLGMDGRLDAQTSFHQHTHFSGANPKRQDKPHAHGVTFSPDNRFVLVPDLGGDRVYIYAHNPATHVLTPHAAQPWLESAPGSGPRHAAFSTDGRQLYIINELANTVDVSSWDAAAGTLAHVQTISTLPAGFKGTNTTAEIAVSRDGRFVYGSNRGHDSIAVFSRSAADGQLALLQNESTRGKNPRHFTLSPDGCWLLAANQDTLSITVFRVGEDGRLTFTSQIHDLPVKPVCVRF